MVLPFHAFQQPDDCTGAAFKGCVGMLGRLTFACVCVCVCVWGGGGGGDRVHSPLWRLV